MNLRILLFTSFMVSILSSCSSIPQAAIDTNKQVSLGISAIGENGIEMANAWEQTAYNMLDEIWSKVYKKADRTYREKKGISSDKALTPQQQEDVAGLAALIRSEVRLKIKAEADSMRGIINANTNTTLAANESITSLLVSANAVATFQQTAIKEVGNLISIPPAISTFITDSLKAAEL